MISINDLLSPVSADQAMETILNVLEAIGLPARKWKAGGTARTILRVVAQTQAGFSTLMVAALSGMFLESATGGWLILLAYYVYGVEAIPSTFASGSLTLVNSGGGIYTFGPREARFQNTATKVVYTNVAGFTLNASATLPIDIEAVTSGASGSSVPGAVDKIVTGMLGVTCSNSLSVVGLDAEKDPALRTRCREKLAIRSVRGPRDAYSVAAKSAKRIGGSPVNINRVGVSASSSTGIVTVYCASPSGAPLSDDLDAASAAIENDVRPEGATVIVLAVTPVEYSETITIWAQTTPGVTAAAVQTATEQAISDFIENYPIGGLLRPDTSTRALFGSGIASVIGAASPARVFSIEGGTTPGGSLSDLLLVAGQVATDGVTVNVQMSAAA